MQACFKESPLITLNRNAGIFCGQNWIKVKNSGIKLLINNFFKLIFNNLYTWEPNILCI